MAVSEISKKTNKSKKVGENKSMGNTNKKTGKGKTKTKPKLKPKSNSKLKTKTKNKEKMVVIEGSHAVAEAVRLCKPKVVAAFPITPQTHIVERLAWLVANGMLDAEYVNVESEHSALSLVAGAVACGVRAYTATSSQGLALMHEVLFATSGMRLPVVMHVANRALSAPLNIWNDLSDTMAQRDSSWIQLYAENVQESVDFTFIAYKVAEEVMLPAMVCMDGYTLTHVYEPVSIPEQWQVDDYLPEYKTDYKLDVENPMLIGAYALPDDYMEFKYDQQLAMDAAMTKLEEESKEFEKKFNRRFDLIEEYKLETNMAIVSMGSVCGTIKDAIDNFDEDVGLLRLIAYRPFPKDKIRDALRNVETVIVIDRAFSYGFEGILFSEIKSAFYNVEEKPKIFGYIAGLGGRDIRIEDIHRIIEDVKQAEKEGEWIGLRGVYA